MLSSSSSSSLSSSSITAFVIGAAAAFSLVWVSNKLQTDKKQRNVKQSNGDKITNNDGTMTATNANDNADTESSTLMDSPELDHRMLRKAEAVIQWRTTRLILVIERCVNDHNYSAILRTAEALGIQNVWMIDPPIKQQETSSSCTTTATTTTTTNNNNNDNTISTVEGDDDENTVTMTSLKNNYNKNHEKGSPEEHKARELHHLFARKALEWLTVRDFATAEDCVTELRKLQYTLWVTDLSQEAVSLPMPSSASSSTYETTTSNDNNVVVVPNKVALVMGTEAVGCSQYMLNEADLRVYLPLRGFADSLNLSVATALIIHHLFVLDPTLIGSMTKDEKHTLRIKWYTKLCQQRLLTAQQKKIRKKLIGSIRHAEQLKQQAEQNPDIKLQPKQLEKIDNINEWKKELEKINDILDPKKIQLAIQQWIDDPPSPLSDVRRADSHRVTFVGKGTKKLHQDHWKDMVATTNSSGITLASASAFRDKMKEAEVASSAGATASTSN